MHLRDAEGWTPLLCCCMNDVSNPNAPGRVACLRMLLDAGADVNAQTVVGASALFMACTHEVPQYELISALLAAGTTSAARLRRPAWCEPACSSYRCCARRSTFAAVYPRAPPASHLPLVGSCSSASVQLWAALEHVQPHLLPQRT